MWQPEAVSDVIRTLGEIGHRLTRQALSEALDKAGRRRPESVVSDGLAQLSEVGLLDNRQDKLPKGYGCPGW
jgi:hypothetical protein